MGYNLSDDMSVKMLFKALKMAVRQRNYSWQLVHHSDRGLQYAAELYQSKLRKEEISTINDRWI